MKSTNNYILRIFNLTPPIVKNRVLLLFVIILCQINFGKAQDNPYELIKYTFINYEQNVINIGGDSTSYTRLFKQFTQVALKGQGKINIVQIGDSHIQADYFSGSFRKKLQSFFLGSISGRGFIFPYKIAKTNNPINYRVKYTGTWESCRNVEQNFKCNLGLSGIAVYTNDSLATITMNIADPNLLGYDFDKLMVFHNTDSNQMTPNIIFPKPISKTTFPDKGYTLFEFNHPIDSIVLGLSKKNKKQQTFTLHGLNFDSKDAGITYHTVGVNGAKVESYLKCNMFVPHLSALNPDWVIVSLGTNDVYTNNFDTVAFKEQWNQLIANILLAAPKSAILLTTPGDHRIKRSYTNENTEIASNIMKRIANEQQLSFWDFNSIMGGKGSIDAWVATSMGHTDFLHYTRKGYEYQAQLLFNAFLKAYDAHIENE